MHLFVSACCWLAFLHGATAQGGESARSADDAVQAQNTRAAMPDSQFAIGDFDGDRQPDLATVEITYFNSLRSRYSISFRLSKGRLETIGVTGPAGGLLLLARDVNGDRALDLVLVTEWRHELVAVLLNDGEGNFSAADPGQFEINAVPSRTQIGIVRRPLEDRTVLSFQYSALRDRGRKVPPERESFPAFSRAPDFAINMFSSSVLGRAPPESVLNI